MDEHEQLVTLLGRLDGSGSHSEIGAVKELRKLGDELPKLLLEKYRSSKNWKVRSSCVYHAIRYARSISEAIQLGIEALSDKSYAVRYRACMLLAYSLNRKALPSLKAVEEKTKHPETAKDIRAAIDAVENQDSDYFVDRDHPSGSVILGG